MGAIHKMAASLGDSPTARALRGNFSSQRSLPHLAENFFLDFLVLLRAKRPHTNKNLFGSTSPSRHKADFCFHRSDKSLREPLRLASVSILWRSSGVTVRWWNFGKTELISMHGVTLRSQGSQCVFNVQEDFLFVKFDSWTMERSRAQHQLKLPMPLALTVVVALLVVHYILTGNFFLTWETAS